MTLNGMYKSLRSFTWEDDKASPRTSELLVEAPLEITINRDRQILIMFTPGMTRELVYGFLYTEGLISSASEVEACVIASKENGEHDDLIEANVEVPLAGTEYQESRGRRVSYSSCGICGKENYYELRQGLGRVKSRQRISMRLLEKLPARLESLQPLYQKTGGSHAAILFDEKGHSVITSEDMGRHNALDKVIGSALIQGIPCENKILLSSGRASLEMILKTARAGIPFFVAMSRPTSRAVEAAKFYNITLLDMAKDTHRVYSHARRVEGF
jgi:FdhD protein